MKPLFATVLPLAFLMACTIETAEPPAGDACGAAALQDLVGQPASVLAAMTFPAPTRVIRPGQAVTMDYNPARLNIEVNAAEIIFRVGCG